ncbi:MAG: CHAP domain-containing protein [Deltaproteobacteria bacterium]|nr:CHAP domain-containing protein [Deltaproteobacteria bacterium]
MEHTPVPVTKREAAAALGPPEGVERVLEQARAHLGKDKVRVKGKAFRYDCSGFVRGMYSALGIDVMSGGGSEDDNGVRLIHHYVETHGQNHSRAVPNAGDIVYFDNTWDKNGNGKLDDPLTHVGLVEEVRADGTVMVIHRANRGIVRDPMNLLRPHELRDEQNHELNAYLRPKGRKEPAGIPHTMAELWAGFGTVEVPRAVSQQGAPGPEIRSYMALDRMLMLAEIPADCGCEE